MRGERVGEVKTYKVSGDLKDGRPFRFFVRCENANLARGVAMSRLMAVRLEPVTIFTAEAVAEEMTKSDRVIVLEK